MHLFILTIYVSSVGNLHLHIMCIFCKDGWWVKNKNYVIWQVMFRVADCMHFVIINFWSFWLIVVYVSLLFYFLSPPQIEASCPQINFLAAYNRLLTFSFRGCPICSLPWSAFCVRIRRYRKCRSNFQANPMTIDVIYLINYKFVTLELTNIYVDEMERFSRGW